jgi:hypothetical protein
MMVTLPSSSYLSLSLFSSWRLEFELGDDSSGHPSLGGGTPLLLVEVRPLTVGRHTPKLVALAPTAGLHGRGTVDQGSVEAKNREKG